MSTLQGQQNRAMGVERKVRNGEMLPTIAVGWRASALRGEEAGRFREVAGLSIVAAGGPRSRIHFNSRQPSGLSKLNRAQYFDFGMSLLGYKLQVPIRSIKYLSCSQA